jgi:hypothetical protein
VSEEELALELDGIKARLLELEKLARIVRPPPGAKRYALVQRVLAGASAKLSALRRGYGHKWILKRADPRVRFAYTVGLAMAVFCCAEDVTRQVQRALFVMQCAVASIEGKTLEELFL